MGISVFGSLSACEPVLTFVLRSLWVVVVAGGSHGGVVILRLALSASGQLAAAPTPVWSHALRASALHGVHHLHCRRDHAGPVVLAACGAALAAVCIPTSRIRSAASSANAATSHDLDWSGVRVHWAAAAASPHLMAISSVIVVPRAPAAPSATSAAASSPLASSAVASAAASSPTGAGEWAVVSTSQDGSVGHWTFPTLTPCRDADTAHWRGLWANRRWAAAGGCGAGLALSPDGLLVAAVRPPSAEAIMPLATAHGVRVSCLLIVHFRAGCVRSRVPRG